MMMRKKETWNWIQRLVLLINSSSNSSKWVYAVFWRILPRNYPPPKWDFGGSFLDRSKGNKRNWILVWEDGFCDFSECERAGSGYLKGRFGADVFFKMSHEVYNYGEGSVGKIAAENSHKWVFRENPPEKDPHLQSHLQSSWNGSIDPQPKAWDFQFNSGIQTIAIISVREGIIQLGSLEKIVEDLNLVISIQRKFSYLQSIPGVFTMQRPYLIPSHQYPNTLKLQTQMTDFLVGENRQLTGGKRCYGDRIDELPTKSINLGWNSPHISREGFPFSSIPPLLPTMSCSLEALLSKLPSVIPTDAAIKDPDTVHDNNNDCNLGSSQRSNTNGGGELAEISRVKTESCVSDTSEEEKPQNQTPNPNSSLEV
ncbi:Transcription factor MYC/MYB N-terminal [Macleaya cordata]|uniref:Transcription factor MYC/MYB N-terminal n=1 Tax=Macleaya cordata TaxID=56857 RepID=A0A200QZM1_MACCD|nr:Transcription factor MYC/MYB N-terminal [Macleaya cordata]